MYHRFVKDPNTEYLISIETGPIDNEIERSSQIPIEI